MLHACNDSKNKSRFEVWCGFDYTGYDKPGWEKHAVAELERCYKKGATGVGELGDKGLGEFYRMILSEESQCIV